MRAEVSEGPTLRDRQKEAVRRELQVAALILFSQNGFASTSVDDIARHAGVSRSTFFRYFGSKEAVFAEHLEEGPELYLRLLEARPSGEGRLEALENTLIALTELMQSEERREEMLLVDGIIATDPSLNATREAVAARRRQDIARVLAKREGRDEPDIEDALAAAVLSQITDVATSQWRDGDARPVEELIRSHFRSLRRLCSE